MIPYYDEAGITIYHADCLDVLPSLSDIGIVVTSPPYNLGMHPSGVGSGMHAGSGYSANGKVWNRVADLSGGYETYDDAMPQDDYDAWQAAVVHACWGTLVDDGALFYNHKPRPMNGELSLPLQYGTDLPLRQIIVWDRGVGMNFSQSHFLPKSEWIVLWAKPAFRLVDRAACEPGDVWRFGPENGTQHPAPFPLELPTRCIRATAPGTVLDPFMGSGTTLRAAKNLGRRAIGIETSERYCELAVERLGQEVLAL